MINASQALSGITSTRTKAVRISSATQAFRAGFVINQFDDVELLMQNISDRASAAELRLHKNKLGANFLIEPESFNVNQYLHEQISSHLDFSSIYQMRACRIMTDPLSVDNEKVSKAKKAEFKPKINVKHKRLS